jgi:hypothetical protein
MRSMAIVAGLSKANCTDLSLICPQIVPNANLPWAATVLS